MKCPKCGSAMILDLELTGGCHGHFGEDDRCYCDSPDVHVDFVCGNPKCQRRLSIGVLSDQYSIERWLNDNFTLPADGVVFERKSRW